MLGAIAGDVTGSVHEWAETKTKDFPLLIPESSFTDDSVLTVAVADWILHPEMDLVQVFHHYFEAYPGRGYGGMFHQWAENRNREPYNSFGPTEISSSPVCRRETNTVERDASRSRSTAMYRDTKSLRCWRP